MRSASVADPVDSVNPNEVSSTSLSMSQACLMLESGEENCIPGVIKRSNVPLFVTTSRVSLTAGEAPLPWPVPNNGECGVP